MKKLQTRQVTRRPLLRRRVRRVVQDSVSLLFSRVLRIFSNPFALVVLGTAAALYVTHLEAAAEKNLVTKLVTRLQQVSALRPIATWVHNNAVHFVGLVCFSVPILLVVPSRFKATAALVAVLYVMLVPQAVALDYVWQAGLLFAWFIAKERQSKWLVSGLAFLAYSLEWVAVKF